MIGGVEKRLLNKKPGELTSCQRKDSGTKKCGHRKSRRNGGGKMIA